MNIPNSPNSILTKIQNFQLRALVDTGAALSLLKADIYNNLKYRPKLQRTDVSLQSANGSSIKVLGSIDLDFKIAGIKLKHEFIVVTDLNRNIILGRDFLMKNKVRIYCDLHKLKLQNAYVPLENDVHISAISRLNKTITLKPQTA